MIKITKDNIVRYLLVVLGSALFFAIPNYYLYSNIKDMVVLNAQRGAEGIASATAQLVLQDIESYKKLSSVEDYQAGGYDEEYYKRMVDVFLKIKKDTGAMYVYTEKKISDEEVAYIIDADEPIKGVYILPGEKDSMASNDLRVFNTGAVTSSDLIRDPKWGLLLTGYAPIIDSVTGQILGVVGVDFSSEYITGLLSNVRRIFYLSFLLMMVLAVILIGKLLELRDESRNKDPLTQLHNKLSFDHNIKRILENSLSGGKTFCLLMMDVDNFKSINDVYGHIAGNKILISVADSLKENTRNTDICFRFGGDEFGVILPDSDRNFSVSVAKRIQEKIGKLDLHDDNGALIETSLSIGIAEWYNGMSADKLLDHADEAMYCSKNGGKNTISVYEE